MHAANTTRHSTAAPQVGLSPRVFLVIFSLVCLLILNTSSLDRRSQANAFHLSFRHRLVKSIENKPKQEELAVQQYSSSNPLRNPQENLIRPIECRNANNQSEAGICMFSIDCMQNKGVPLSICKHNYFVGTCCKLPDHNNFVGIVYDLRETENGQQQHQTLEARRGPSEALHVFKSTLTESLPTTPTAATPTSSSGEFNPQAASTLAASHSDQSEKSVDHSNGGSSSAPEQEQQFSTTSKVTLEETSKKYLISSTKLFAPPEPTGASTQSALKSSVGDGAAAEVGAKQPVAEASGTARNADGSFQEQQVASSQISFTSLDQQNSTLNSAYELLATAPTNQNKSLTPAQDSAITFDNGIVQQSVESVFGQKPKVVPSNEHQATSSSMAPSSLATSAAASSSSTSDQEFTLSGSSQSSSTALFELTGGSGSSTASQQQEHAPSSPFFDLISSSSSPSLAPTESPSPTAQYETTTPFTSSLTTAILPNISAHTYTSTAATTTATSHKFDSTTAAPTQPQSQLLVSTSSSTTSSSQSEAPLASAPPASVSPFVAQYYSTASAPHERSTQSPPSQPPSQPNHHHRQPTSNSPLASKIVISSSASNNLIPSLSGLQSAILSHIPFKIASGLSSGLSSYLQAAMKPGGNLQGPSRPLISSNNAPALQYQQLQQQLNQSSSTSSRPMGQMSSVRFPTANSSSESHQATSVALAAASTPPPAQQRRDVVKEAQLVCGRPRVAETKANKRSARIVGGNQSAFGQWPWMVSLRQWRKGAFLHKCGAALLNENWAITAAHCVENVKAPDLLLRLGEFDVSNQNEPFPYIERRVKTVVSHPSFDPKTFEYDLALIRFTEPIQYERNIIPVCVPQGNDSYVDRMATVIGWGRLFEDGPLPDVIQHVDVPIITNQECENMYKSAGFVEEIPQMFICAGISKGGRDSCEGDSGGPLTMVDHDGRSYLVGIISWGIGCALPSQPGVYTRITAFSSWINQMMAN